MKAKPKIKPNFDIFYISEDNRGVLFRSVNEEYFIGVKDRSLLEKLIYHLNGENLKIDFNYFNFLLSRLKSANILEDSDINFKKEFIEECYRDITSKVKKITLKNLTKNKKITLFTFDRLSPVFLKLLTKLGIKNISCLHPVTTKSRDIENKASNKIKEIEVNKPNDINEVLSKSDVVVCCLNSTFREFFIQVNNYCINNGIPVIYAQIDGLVGPTVLSKKSSCFECFDSRVKESWWYKPFRFILPSKNFAYFNNSKIITKKVLNNTILELIRTLFTNQEPKFENKVLILNGKSETCNILKKNNCPHHNGNKIRDGTSLKIPKNVCIKLNDRKVVYKENDLRIVHPSKTIAKAKRLVGKFGVITEINKKSLPAKPFFHWAKTSDPTVNDLKMLINQDRLLKMRRHSGKGITLEQNEVSCIMEAIERYSAKIHGDEQFVRGSYENFKKYAINPKNFLISKTQFENYHDDLEIDWSWAYSLVNKKPVLVPSNFVYVAYFDPKTSRFLNYSTNGLASGNCIEEAILHGIFEVVERDAYYIMNANRLCMPDINIKSVKRIGDTNVNKFLDFLETEGIEYFIKYITNDIPIPVILTFVIKKDGKNTYFSCSACSHTNPNIALSRSLTEAIQSYPLTTRTPGINELKHLYQRGKKKIEMHGIEDKSSDNLKNAIETCSDIFRNMGFDILVVNLTRPEIAFPTVRVIIPGLQPEMTDLSFPRFSKRLYEVPKKLGYMKTKPKDLFLTRLPAYPTLYERIRFSI